MNLRFFSAIFALLATAGISRAYWIQPTYTLKGGWNAIYLHGDATYATPDVLFPQSPAPTGVVEEIWRWNPKPNQIQFTTTPLIPAAGTPEWNVWKRGLPAQSNLTMISGQTAYLIKCSGDETITHPAFTLTQRAMPPSALWVRSGANLLGFPAKPTTPPSFSTYFQSFPAATAANAKIFKYVGGNLTFANPIQLFSTTLESVDRNKAYWFEAEVVGNFYAPLDISLSQATGLDFGRTGSVITARLRNNTAANMTITLTPATVSPSLVPSLQEAIASAPVPLTRRTFNTVTGTWTEALILGAYTEVIGANSAVELSFGVNRAAMTVPNANFYASLLKLTDSGSPAGLFEINLPVSARVASMTGLWVGDATITNVLSKVQSTATAKTVLTNGVVTGIELIGAGFGYTSVPTAVIAPPSGITATATATLFNGGITALAIANPGSGYLLPPTVTIAAPQTAGITASATAIIKGGVVAGFIVTQAGSGYTAAPAVTMAAPAGTVQAVAASAITTGAVTNISVSNPGAGYFTPPAVTVAAAPAGGTTATAVAVVSNGRVTGITVLIPGAGYIAAPAITIAAPPSRTTATVIPVMLKGKVTGFTITNGGSGYLAPPSVTFPPAPAPGTATSRTPPLRVLLHVDAAGTTTTLLSQIFVGTHDDGSPGLWTKESYLSSTEKATASRLVAAHLPLDRVLSTGTGSVANNQTLVRTVSIPFNDDTNPFVHRYHPDHNNKDARGVALGAGVESYDITREFRLLFTPTPPAGVSALGWGSTAIGGTYTEIITGLHKQDLTVSGTFVLRRVSETATLTNN